MKRFLAGALAAGLLALAGCAPKPGEQTTPPTESSEITEPTDSGSMLQEAAQPPAWGDETLITLVGDAVQVNGQPASGQTDQAVYTAKDIVYYQQGQDFTYGDGEEKDAHSPEEAGRHTVVHITKPGVYRLQGKLSAGQIAVDLGEGAEQDPQAVVQLILDGVDITCTVAPGIVFYRVYECGDAGSGTKDVDTSAAGANILLADGSENVVSGSYVAKIYKSYTLSEDGTSVEDSEKLHKYDGAVYSKMSMNVDGDTGVLRIFAENEGLDSELHLTVNGGNLYIESGNDGINTNEDNVSVTTINGGLVQINVTGATGEGDGIDSNGYLVINGGTVLSSSCATSGDAGLDADCGIFLNGGTVLATGNMVDRIDDSQQNYVVLSFAERQTGGSTYTLCDSAGNPVQTWTPVNDFTYLVASAPELTPGDYTLFCGERPMLGSRVEQLGAPGRPEGMGNPPEDMPEPPEDMPEPPEGMENPPEGIISDPGVGMPPDGVGQPLDGEPGTPPDGGRPNDGGPGMPAGQNREDWELSQTFTIQAGGNFFAGVIGAE